MVETETINIGNGIVLSYPTEDELEYIEQTFRDGDKMEHDFFGGSLKCPEGMPAWTVKLNGEIIGAGGFCMCADGGYLSRGRVAWFLSCKNADKHKIAFVRYSPFVLKAMVKTLPEWVENIFVTPMSDYTMSVRWLSKVMKMTTIDKVIDQYCEFTIMMAKRKDIENV